MTNVPYPSDIERLEENIRDEIRAQNGTGGLDLDDATIRRLAACIAANVDYAFKIDWQPRWVPSGGPHRWTDSGDGSGDRHFVECLRCKKITMHTTSELAETWYADHRRIEHSNPLT